MASPTSRIFYPVLGVAVGPTPATGYSFLTGFNNVYTGANSGVNQIRQLQRLQSITDNFSIPRTNIGQLGQLSILSREIITSPDVGFGGSYMLADLSNERVLGLDVSGTNAALTNILNKTQNEKNYYIAIAPQGQDLINWTGQSQVIAINNGFLASYRTEGSVGNIPTAQFSVQGLNWATYTGSVNQPNLAIDTNLGQPITGVNFTLPVFTSGLSNTVSALRPIDITMNLNSAAIGLDLSDIKLQSYSISFDLNLEGLSKLGNRFAYSREIRFPVTLNASVTAYFGNLVTGSLNTILCNDVPYTLQVVLNDPCSNNIAALYTIRGAKIDSMDFGSQDIGSVASTVTINYSTTIGGPNDTNNNLFLSGRNI